MGTTRPKGYMRDWQPKPEVARILLATAEILDEYGRFGPMTVRQVFYRLVGNYGYDKTEQAYKRLAGNLVKARRAQMIDFRSIRDDGGTTRSGATGYDSADEFLQSLSDDAMDGFALDPTMGQPVSVEVWCEAEGMVPMLGRMVNGFGASVTGSGGFSSVTVTHAVAQRILRRPHPTVLLHVGDFDPSGESIFKSMCQDIGKFVVEGRGGKWNPNTGETFIRGDHDDDGPDFRPRRVALTADQVEEHDLPTAPPKASDSRSARWVGETTQAEALPPDLLEEIVTDAVREHIDVDAWEAVRSREEAQREIMGEKVRDAVERVREELADELADES